MYWIGATDSEPDLSTIFRYSLSSSKVDTVITDRGLRSTPGRKFIYLTIDSVDGKVYWTDAGFDLTDNAVILSPIMRASLDGSNPELLFPTVCGLGIPTDIEVAGRTLFWSTETDCRGSDLASIGLDTLVTTGVDTLDTLLELGDTPLPYKDLDTNGPHSVKALEVDTRNQNLFWINNDLYGRPPPGIYRAPISDTRRDTLILPGSRFSDMALDQDAGKLYWVDRDSPTIHRVNVDGTESVVVFTSDTTVSRLVVDHQGRKLYWSERDAGRIRRANLDGTGIETVLSGLTLPTGLALNFGKPVFVSTAPEAEGPPRTGLGRVYPNPLRQHATVAFTLADPGQVMLEIYDAMGRRVEVLAQGAYGRGTHEVKWDGAELSSGVYFCRLSSERTTETVVVVLQR